MEELFAAWQFALQRLRAGWRLMLVAAVGVVAAATLLAVAPIYANAMSDLGLRFRLEQGLPAPSERVVHVNVDNMALGDPVQQATRRAMDEVTEARVGWLGPEVIVEERSPRFDLSFPAFVDQAPEEPVPVPEPTEEPLRQPWGAFLFWLSDFEDHVTVTDGRLPGPSSDGAEVVLPDGFQRHAALGDTVEVNGPRYDNCERVPASEDPEEAAAEVRCRPSTFISTTATATIVGFVAPDDPDDLRWQFFQGDWEAPEVPFMPRMPEGGEPTVEMGFALAGRGSMPLLTTQEQYFGAFAQRLPELGTRHRVGLVPDLDGLQLSEVPRAIDDLRAWRSDINDTLELTAPAQLRVLEQLERFRNTQTFSQIPLLLILIQVVGIVIYYVVMVMGMLLDRQSEEIGVYRSRGASTSQLVGFTLIEGIVLAVPAALFGPWLASQVVGLLGYTGTFEPITGGSALPAAITPDAYLLAAAGASLSLLAMLLPSFAAARRGIVDVKRQQSRPPGRSFIQRYFLDFAVVGLAVLLLWQLEQRGTVFDPDSIGGWSSDPLLLLSPFVFTLAVAAMVLRFYPPLLRLVVRILLAFKGTAVAIGLRRAGRSPAAYARLMLLLVMATAVGTFAASYGPTVDRSLEERVRYAAGVDVRAAIGANGQRDAAAALEEVRAIEGVRDATLIHRGRLPALSGSQVPVIAIDVDRAASMLWFRDDFAEEPLPDLLRSIQSAVPAGGGLTLPDDATSVDVGMLVESQTKRALIRMRFRDADGRFLYTVLEQPEEPPEGWFTATAEVPTHLTAPLTIIGLHVTDLLGQNLRTEGSLTFDDITAVRANGERVLLDGFEGGFNWSIYAERDANELFEVVSEEPLSGEQAAKWTWSTTITPRGRILALTDPAVPVGAIMNGPAMGVFGTGPGGIAFATFEDFTVPFAVHGTAEMFPTLAPESGFVIVNIDHFRSLAGTVGYEDGLVPTELWLDFEDSLPLEEQRAIVASLEDRVNSPLLLEGELRHQQAELAEIEADPTLQASGSGILVVAFIAVLGLSTLGFLVTLVLGARARATEFAVLRAVGSSQRQILRSMLLEWGVVLVIGGTIGVLLGRRVASVMLSFLDVTDEGARVLPPFILETNWVTLAFGVGLLVALVIVGLGVSWLSAMRRASSAQLRVTQ